MPISSCVHIILTRFWWQLPHIIMFYVSVSVKSEHPFSVPPHTPHTPLQSYNARTPGGPTTPSMSMGARTPGAPRTPGGPHTPGASQMAMTPHGGASGGGGLTPAHHTQGTHNCRVVTSSRRHMMSNHVVLNMTSHYSSIDKSYSEE